MDKSALTQILDAWRVYEDYTRSLCRAYFAAKYGDWTLAKGLIENAFLGGLNEDFAQRLIAAIEKEQE